MKRGNELMRWEGRRDGGKDRKTKGKAEDDLFV